MKQEYTPKDISEITFIKNYYIRCLAKSNPDLYWIDNERNFMVKPDKDPTFLNIRTKGAA